MPAPTNSLAALSWVQAALDAGRYVTAAHFDVRCQERGVSLLVVKRAIRRATGCATYPDGTPSQGGTCWRVTGLDDAGNELCVGVEAFVDAAGEQVVLVTVFWR